MPVRKWDGRPDAVENQRFFATLSLSGDSLSLGPALLSLELFLSATGDRHIFRTFLCVGMQ